MPSLLLQTLQVSLLLVCLFVHFRPAGFHVRLAFAPAQFASTTVQLTYTVWSLAEVYCLPGTDLQSQHLGAAAVG